MNNDVSAAYVQQGLKPSYFLRRQDTKAGRSYARIPYDITKEKVYLLPSVTTILDKVVGNDELIEWQMSMGKDRAAFIAEKAAHYGSLMHIAFAVFLETREFNLDTCELFVQQYKRDKGIRYDVSDFTERLKEDLIAFAQWIYDYKVEPIAIEIPLADSVLGYAGTIDLVAFIEVEEKGFFGETYKTGDKKGLPKESSRKVRTCAIIDFKSNRKTFHFSNTLQVEGFYRALWNRHIMNMREENSTIHPNPEFIATASFLWRPSTTETKISYAFSEQTSEAMAQAGEHYLALYNMLEAKPADKKAAVIADNVILRFGSEPVGTWETKTQEDIVQELAINVEERDHE